MKLSFDVYEPDVRETSSNPIVLLHSILETKKTWKPIARPLARLTGRKVYAYDARSHGESPWVGDYTIDVLVNDLVEFLRDNSITKAILIGHSLGGKVAITFTLKYPERVESLIVEDVPVRNFRHRLHNLVPVGVKVVEQMKEDLQEINDRDEAEQYLREMGHRFSQILKATPEGIDSYHIDYLPFNWKGNFYQLEINIDAIAESLQHNTLQTEVSGRFTGDALFIFGEKSQFKGDQDQTIEEFFPRAVKVIFKGAGHFIHQTFPQKYLSEVVHFIHNHKDVKAKY